MKSLKQNAIIMVLLLTGTLLATNADARQKVSKRIKKQSAVSQTATPDYSLQMASGKMTVSDGTNVTTISKDPNDVQPLINGNEVYFIHKGGSNEINGSSIYVYNITAKAKENIIKQNAVAANYNTKNEIENILIDKKSNKMFFSTALTKTQGYVEKLVWKYDISTKQLEVYKDGSIESIDEAGNQVIAVHGIDSKGHYSLRSVLNAEGKLQRVLGKQYDLTSNNK